MSQILIIGDRGNMGSRYKAVLNYLGMPFYGVDKEVSDECLKQEVLKSSRVIVATPTDTHVKIIKNIAEYRVPILCEKPITKNLFELKSLLTHLRNTKCKFSMIYQYKILDHKNTIGPSYYNYFKHGTDGLAWDCIQILGLARGPVQLAESSPIWSCKLNGRTINIRDMDAAYIAFIQNWLREPEQDHEEIEAVHETASEYAEKLNVRNK